MEFWHRDFEFQLIAAINFRSRSLLLTTTFSPINVVIFVLSVKLVDFLLLSHGAFIWQRFFGIKYLAI